MAQTKNAPADAPIGEMNTTPLIDVMLVLLIMFVITIPVATHTVETDLPRNGRPVPIDTIKNRLSITEKGTILWNGTPTDKPALLATLRATRDLPIEPELQFAPLPRAPYDTAAQVMGIVKQSGVTKFGFVGNEQFAEFGKPG
jgi:biopolymer transport protein ExbD